MARQRKFLLKTGDRIMGVWEEDKALEYQKLYGGRLTPYGNIPADATHRIIESWFKYGKGKDADKVFEWKYNCEWRKSPRPMLNWWHEIDSDERPTRKLLGKEKRENWLDEVFDDIKAHLETLTLKETADTYLITESELKKACKRNDYTPKGNTNYD
jgi:hypothetical protein